MRRLSMPIFLFFSLWSFSAAQRILTLDQAIDLALDQNREVVAQEYRLRGVEGLRKESRAGFWPQLTFRAAYERIGEVSSAKLPAIGATPAQTIELGQRDNVDASVGFEQVLFSWGRILSTYRAKEYEREAEVAALHAIRSEVAYRTAEAFYRALQARELWRVKQKGYERAQDHERIAADRHSQGLIPRFEWLRTKSHTSSFKPQVIEAEHAYRRALLRFQETIGLPLDEPIALEGDFRSPQSVEDFDHAYARSLRERPEFHRLMAKKEALSQLVKATRAELRPSLLAKASYRYQFPAPNFEERFDDNWSVGAAIEFPLFNGFATSGRVDLLKAEIAEIDIEKLQLKDRVWLEVRESLDRVEEGWELIEARQEELSVAQEALKIAEVSFKEGVVPNSDVLDSQLALDEAEVALLDAWARYQIAVAAFKRATGGWNR